MDMTKAVSPFYSWKISLALQSARACSLREEDEDSRFDLLVKIVGAQVRAGDREGAYGELTSSREFATKDADFLAKMAEAQVSIGDLDGALSTIRQGLSSDEYAFSFFMTLCRIAGVLGKIADKTTANEALALAERTFGEHLLKEKAKNNRTTGGGELAWLTYLAQAQAIGGRREKAKHTLQSALELVSSDGYDLLGRQEVIDSGYSAIVAVQAGIGDIPGALKTLERISEGERIERGILRIVFELANGGDLSGALSFVARIDEAKPKTQALLGIAGIQARHGDSAGAKNTLAFMKLSTDVAGRCEHAEVLLRIALAEGQRGDRESARCTLAESVHIVDKSVHIVYEARQSFWRVAAFYAAAGEVYAAVGMVEEAQRIFERETSGRDSLVRTITKAHTVAGNVEIAEAWIRTLPSATEQCSAWLGIVDGLVSLSYEG